MVNPIPTAKASGNTVPSPAQSFHLRTQHDNLGDTISRATATINDEPSETKTEFADEADVNKLLDRYVGPQSVQQRQVKYGETIDYSMDLQQALHAVGEAEAAHRTQVPKELQSKYPTWREWLNAAANGSYSHELAELAKKKADAEPKPKTPEETPNSPPTGEKEMTPTK